MGLLFKKNVWRTYMKQVRLLSFKLVALPAVAHYVEEEDSRDEALAELFSVPNYVLKDDC